jgi:hypothetical protein
LRLCWANVSAETSAVNVGASRGLM